MNKNMLLILMLLSILSLHSLKNNYDFKNETQNKTLSLKNFKGRVKPKLLDGAVELVNGGYAKNHNNAIVFPDSISNQSETEHYSFELFISPGAEGAGFALINLKQILDDSLSYMTKSWESPNFPESFSVGFDVYNPQTSAWFDEFGNFYGRPQREISLHWNNNEVLKILSPVEFRADPIKENSSKFDVSIKYVTAGAKINITVNDTLVIKDFFIPEMAQYTKKAVFGASTSELTCSVYLSKFEFETSGLAPQFKLLKRQVLLKDEVFHAGRRNMSSNILFPNLTKNANKAILTLDLSGAKGGLSAWDVGAAIYLIDKDSVRYEICRFITPYNRAYVWKIDVTDYLPLFEGNKGLFAKVDTWETVSDDPEKQKGWKVNACIDFYQGNESGKAFEVKNLWSGYYEYGNPEKPLKDKLTDFDIAIPKSAKKAKLRITVTGHGMSPNSENAGEFKPSARTVIVNNSEFQNLLWKTDCYLNSCRPQDGTWKFDRTGWAPGSIPFIWEIELTDQLKGNKTLKLKYLPDDYINTNIGDHYPPHQWIEAQIIFYK